MRPQNFFLKPFYKKLRTPNSFLQLSNKLSDQHSSITKQSQTTSHKKRSPNAKSKLVKTNNELFAKIIYYKVNLLCMIVLNTEFFCVERGKKSKTNNTQATQAKQTTTK